MFIDTHTHLYLENFSKDRKEVIENAISKNISKLLLPNIDSSSIKDLLNLEKEYPNNCIPMMGLHPCSVKEDYRKELQIVEDWLNKHKFIAIGEIGLDYYWDKSFVKEQKDSFNFQLNLAKSFNLPVAIHIRDAFDDTFEILENIKGVNGVFHCFSGNLDEAKRAIDLGYKLGINGIVTFKNSGLDKIIEQIDMKDIVLETDSPYLAPAPHRGKRNESSYIIEIATRISEIKNINLSTVEEITTNNVKQIFKIDG